MWVKKKKKKNGVWSLNYRQVFWKLHFSIWPPAKNSISGIKKKGKLASEQVSRSDRIYFKNPLNDGRTDPLMLYVSFNNTLGIVVVQSRQPRANFLFAAVSCHMQDLQSSVQMLVQKRSFEWVGTLRYKSFCARNYPGIMSPRSSRECSSTQGRLMESQCYCQNIDLTDSKILCLLI